MSGGINNDDVQSTEDEILNNVEDITGESFDGDDDNEQETEQQDTDADASDEDETADNETTEEAAKLGEDNTRQRVDRTEIQRRIPSQRRTDYDYDPRTGDVINPKDGSVIFKNGTVEREMFSQLQNTRYEADKFKRQNEEYLIYGRGIEAQLQAYKNVPDVADQLKLDTKDQVTAFQHMAQFKADPVKALRGMLTQFQVDGGDLTDIFDNLEKIQLEGLEARLTKHVDALTKPQQEEQARVTQHDELVQKLNAEVTAFFNDNPEAEQHTDLLSHIINKAAENQEQLSLSNAWMRVLKFANARKLDLSGDLRAQLQPPEPERRPAPRPMPNGRNSGRMTPTDVKPSHERRNKDIVAEAMREAGFAV